MGKITGFLEWKRRMPNRRDPRDRLADYREFYDERPEDEKRAQAGRCMDCGVPFCQQGCPLGNIIPDWNDLVYRDRWQAAWNSLDSTNNFPEFTGRLCPAPCEAACTLAINDQPITIEQIEREIIERAFQEGWVRPRAPRARSGKRIAIVGSGPAGLAAAVQLNRAGHEVVVFERADRIGGLLRYGIPDFKMEKWVIDRRLRLMEAEGVRFRTGVDVGRDLPWAELQRDHDAVLLAVGAGRPRDLDVPGRDLDGVLFAMDFLEAQNRRVAGDTLPDEPTAHGRHVVVLGGGDTGSDCVGTSLRQGAASVTQIELLPAPPETRAADNPWPRWPLVFRTSSSQEEGGQREFAVMTTRISGRNGRIERLHAVRVDVVRDAGGATRLVPIEGSEFELPCDLLLLAMGYVSPVVDTLVDALGVELDRRGNLAVDRQFRTSVPGIWAAGDAMRGASLIVWAISDGREAARNLDTALAATDARLPTRGLDQPF